MWLTLWQSNGLYNPIYLGCQDFLSTRVLPVHPAAGSIIPANRCMIRDGAADGELLIGKDDAGEDQEQWKTRPGPPEHDDS